MSFTAVEAVLTHSEAKGTDRMVMVVIAECADHDGANAWPAIETIAKRANVDRSTVHRALKRLSESGELKVEYKAGPHGCNLYEVTLCGDGDSRKSPPDSRNGETQTTLEPPDGEEKTPSIPPSQQVWDHFCEVMKPRNRNLADDARRIINAALKEASIEECCTAIDRCHASDWHMKREKHKGRKGNRFNRIGHILKPRPRRGETQRDRIDFWLDRKGGEEEKVDEFGWER
jgi:hypothetical protein